LCDTMVALGNVTLDGSVLFAKNSDRQPNEPLLTIRIPRKKHPTGSKVKCTYIEVDQAEETFAVLLLKPSWMWGAEMGANEFGLNIGNEAVFTRMKQGPESLLGMDMLRLALERCRNSDEALAYIIRLIEEHGQGGNCGFEKNFYYHNAFLIADPESAWVLETAGEYWAAEKVSDARSISNRLSIKNKMDKHHPDLIKYAIDRGWCRNESDFSFADCFSNKLVTHFSASLRRKNRADCILSDEQGKITMQTMKEILRSHEEGFTERRFKKSSLASICMHGGFIFGDHTTGSYVANLDNERHTYLITGCSTPCIAIFKPFRFVDHENFTFSDDQEEKAIEFWKKRELLHRAFITNRIPDPAVYFTQREQLENEFDSKMLSAMSLNGDDDQFSSLVNSCLEQEEAFIDATLESIESANKPSKIKGNPYHRYYWKKQNEKLYR